MNDSQEILRSLAGIEWISAIQNFLLLAIIFLLIFNLIFKK
jgi:hypothetical protein